MNRTVTITSKNHKYQNTYGGEIFASDFFTNYPRSNVRSWTDRVISDLKFDNYCRKNIIRKEEK